MNFNKKKKRINYKIKLKSKFPRLVVFRSNYNIYGQLIDKGSGNILLSGSSIDKDIKEEIKKCKTKIEKSTIVGNKIAELMKSKNISNAVFDRNGYLYHGRVKAVGDAIREKGINF